MYRVSNHFGFFRYASLICLGLSLLSLLGACDSIKTKQAVSLPLDEGIVIWVEERAQLIVKHRADCGKMAQALKDHHFKNEAQEEKWKEIRKQMNIDQKMLFDQLYGSRLKTAMEKSRILYEYCSEDEEIRNIDQQLKLK